MAGLEADLRAYYDQEAHERVSRAVDSVRVEQRRLFADQLLSEGRRSLLEIGVGPGRDAVAFGAGNLDVVGIDLSLEHARLASAAGVPALQASLFSLPFPTAHFDAGWSMSTLLHVSDAQFDEAMRSITAVLRPQAPLAIGLWGGLDRESISDFDRISPPRFFSLRSHDRLQEMLGRHGRIERFETWDRDSEWHYQFVVLRVD